MSSYHSAASGRKKCIKGLYAARGFLTFNLHQSELEHTNAVVVIGNNGYNDNKKRF